MKLKKIFSSFTKDQQHKIFNRIYVFMKELKGVKVISYETSKSYVIKIHVPKKENPSSQKVDNIIKNTFHNLFPSDS